MSTDPTSLSSVTQVESVADMQVIVLTKKKKQNNYNNDDDDDDKHGILIKLLE